MKFLILLLVSLFMFLNVFASDVFIDPDSDNYTNDVSEVINTTIDDPLKEWTTDAVNDVNWIQKDYNDEGSTINYVSKWINYFLWILGLIVIIFMIKDGIVIITAAWDDNKQKEALKNVKNYIIALIMIWISYLIVNFVIHFVIVNS